MLDKSRLYSTSISALFIVLSLVMYAINIDLITIPQPIYTPQPSLAEWSVMPLVAQMRNLQDSSPILTHILAVVTIIVGAVVTMFISIKQNLYGSTTHLPLIIYFAIFAALSTPDDLLAPPITALLMALSLSNLYAWYGRLDMNPSLFSGMFYLGLIPLIYPAAAVLLLLFVVVILLLECVGRDIIAAFIALFTPLFIHTYVIWLLGDTIAMQYEAFTEALLWHHGGLKGSLNSMILILAAVPFAIYAIQHIDDLSITLMSRKRTFYAVVAFGVALLMIPFPSFAPSQLLLAAPLMAIFSTTAIAVISSRKAPLFYIGLVILALIVRFIPL